MVWCYLLSPPSHRHRAVNLFLQSYCSLWLMNTEHANHEMLTEELLVSASQAVSGSYIKSPATVSTGPPGLLALSGEGEERERKERREVDRGAVARSPLPAHNHVQEGSLNPGLVCRLLAFCQQLESVLIRWSAMSPQH